MARGAFRRRYRAVRRGPWLRCAPSCRSCLRCRSCPCWSPRRRLRRPRPRRSFLMCRCSTPSCRRSTRRCSIPRRRRRRSIGPRPGSTRRTHHWPHRSPPQPAPPSSLPSNLRFRPHRHSRSEPRWHCRSNARRYFRRSHPRNPRRSRRCSRRSLPRSSHSLHSLQSRSPSRTRGSPILAAPSSRP